MKRTIFVLKSIKLLSINGFIKFMQSVAASGLNLMSFLHYISNLYPNHLALVDETGKYSYKELYNKALNVALYLAEHERINTKSRVALMCRNHADLVIHVFALSGLGVEIFMLNAEMKDDQIQKIVDSYNISEILIDNEFSDTFSNAKHVRCRIINSDIPFDSGKRLKRIYFSRITILTGGTTGAPKTASRKSILANFVFPFHDLLTRVNIQKYDSVYIPVPLYHGFGLTSFLVSIALGKTIYLSGKFNVDSAGLVIERNKIQVIAAVPLILKRLIDHQSAALSSLRCVISGSAVLTPGLLSNATDLLGNIVYNLYGTSEAGFSIMASPYDLKLHPATIGKPISGVAIKVIDEKGNEVLYNSIGRICIHSRTTARNSGKWVETGDLGWQNDSGYFFLSGRIDDMIVSGGQNVYPVELENILLRIPEISEVVVIGIDDKEFGERLKAFVVLKPGADLSEAAIISFLKENAPRFLMPKVIDFISEIPRTALGKPDKKVLKKLTNNQ